MKTKRSPCRVVAVTCDSLATSRVCDFIHVTYIKCKLSYEAMGGVQRTYHQNHVFMFEEAMPENTGDFHKNCQSLYTKTGDTMTS